MGIGNDYTRFLQFSGDFKGKNGSNDYIRGFALQTGDKGGAPNAGGGKNDIGNLFKSMGMGSLGDAFAKAFSGANGQQQGGQQGNNLAQSILGGNAAAGAAASAGGASAAAAASAGGPGGASAAAAASASSSSYGYNYQWNKDASGQVTSSGSSWGQGSQASDSSSSGSGGSCGGNNLDTVG